MAIIGSWYSLQENSLLLLVVDGSLVHGQIFSGVPKSWASSVQMFGQQGHPGECLGAVGAIVLLHVRMCLKMGSQVRPVSEGTVAQRAGERLFARVRADVPLQKPWSWESLAAQDTLAGERVRPDVHLESTQGDVDLLAVLAAEGLLRRGVFIGCAVELLVFREAGVGGVGFWTEGALVPWSWRCVFCSFTRAEPCTADARASGACYTSRTGEIFRGRWWRGSSQE